MNRAPFHQQTLFLRAAGSIAILLSLVSPAPAQTYTISTVAGMGRLLPVTLQIGGQSAPTIYAGAAPSFVAGVLQVNAQAPAGLSGAAPVQLKIGGATTPAGLTVFLK